MAKCSVSDCERDAAVKGFCHRHYRNVWRVGDPLGSTRRNERGASTRHPIYRVWQGMWRRCTDEREARFASYGGRGITVCERWRDFWNFVDDMGERPSANHSIDRINVDGNYEPSNCRWATPKQQASNRRVSRLRPGDLEVIVQLVNEGMSMRQISVQYGLNYDAVRNFVNGRTYQADVADHAAVAPAKKITKERLKFKAPLVEKICSVSFCNDIVYGRDLCRNHYRRAYEGKALSAVSLETPRSCKQCGTQFSDSVRPDQLFCSVACKQASYRADGRFDPEVQLLARGQCPIDGCDKPVHAGGLCSAHYSKLRRIPEQKRGRTAKAVDLSAAQAALAAAAPEPRPCIVCETVFTPKKGHTAQYCSSKCYHRLYTATHREQVRANGAKYQHSEKGQAQREVWEEEKAAEITAKKHEYYLEHREEMIAKATERNRGYRAAKRAAAKEQEE